MATRKSKTYMNLSISSVLLLTACTVGVELLVFAAILIRNGLFHWLSAGFWSWVAFAIYYVVGPFTMVFVSTTELSRLRLQLGGAAQGLWIAFVILVGIGAFFITYLHTSEKIISFQLTKVPEVTPFFSFWLLFFIGFGLYSLLATRTGIASWGGEQAVEQGRFVGDVTGYQYSGFMLLFYPILLLLFWPRSSVKVIGIVLGVIFIVASLPHGWARFATVSMLLALIMWRVANQQRRWPSILAMLSLVLMVLVYQTRAHAAWQFSTLFAELGASLSTMHNEGVSSLVTVDNQMLATFWLKSSWYDKWVGYDYGLRFVNYAFLGWIPSNIFPQKYFIVDWLATRRPPYPEIYDTLMFGGKSSLIGSFYGNGSLIAVIFQMAVVGWLSRRLDGLLHPNAPIPVQALGIAWLSLLWIIWGSGDTWATVQLGILAIPFLTAYPLLILKKQTPILPKRGFVSIERPCRSDVAN